jgi:hypothetical protein
MRKLTVHLVLIIADAAGLQSEIHYLNATGVKGI